MPHYKYRCISKDLCQVTVGEKKKSPCQTDKYYFTDRGIAINFFTPSVKILFQEKRKLGIGRKSVLEINVYLTFFTDLE